MGPRPSSIDALAIMREAHAAYPGLVERITARLEAARITPDPKLVRDLARTACLAIHEALVERARAEAAAASRTPPES